VLQVSIWTRLITLLIVVGGILVALPNAMSDNIRAKIPKFLPNSAVSLGLDLQGGSYLLLQVDFDQVMRDRAESLVGDIRAGFRKAKISFTDLNVRGDTVSVRVTDPRLDEARTLLQNTNPSMNGSVLSVGGKEYEMTEPAPGTFSLRMTDAYKTLTRQQVMDQSIEVVRRRIDALGTREPSIERSGEDRILVQVPGEKDPENIKRLLGKTARLTFQMVDMDGSVQEALAGKVPPGDALLPSDEGEQQRWYLVRKKVELSGENLTDARTTFQDNQPVVSFRFDSTGARAFGRITQENVHKLFAIILDGKVISAPNIREPILGGSGIISGSFTVESANELSILLRSGALPAPLKVIEERSVGAELGADSIRAGTIAAVVACVLVVGLMLVYYGIFGLIADAALVVNVVFILAIMSTLSSTLTLPGIAGIVLTIGTAVDSNVLIYERIREEARHGRTPISAINSGFDEALRTIIDANVTHLIAALALFQFGTGPVKGFAVTLAFGILANMFTSVTLTRLLVTLWYRRARPAVLPL
jgi:protein-export membrane protein SecD